MCPALVPEGALLVLDLNCRTTMRDARWLSTSRLEGAMAYSCDFYKICTNSAQVVLMLTLRVIGRDVERRSRLPRAREAWRSLSPARKPPFASWCHEERYTRQNRVGDLLRESMNNILVI